jgi:hypothetical protein
VAFGEHLRANQNIDFSCLKRAQTFIKFLKRLIKDAKRMVYLILDNLRVHHAKMVKEWLEEKEIRKGTVATRMRKASYMRRF